MKYFGATKWKRLFDIVLSFFGMIVMSPVFLVIICLLLFTPDSKVFFSHERRGRRGKPFRIYKFQTMKNSAPNCATCDLENPEQYITKVGRVLRKTSLDELPQVFNVIKGDMSLVGPRPIIAAEIPKYGEYFADFCLVPPGITGMWQVNGRSDTTYEERVQMDTWYVRNWSVWIDIIYLIKTVTVVLARKGAY